MGYSIQLMWNRSSTSIRFDAPGVREVDGEYLERPRHELEGSARQVRTESPTRAPCANLMPLFPGDAPSLCLERHQSVGQASLVRRESPAMIGLASLLR
jgi:hypothetical protein